MKTRWLLCLLFALLTGCDRLEQLWSSGSPQFHGLDISAMQTGAGLALRDASGKVRRISDFSGKVVLLYFGFTQCPSACPTELLRAAQAQKQLGKQSEKLQTVFVTLDPERDKPEMIDTYAKSFDPSFIALYGTLEETKQAAKDFHLFFTKTPIGDSYTIDHTTVSYLFDPQGRIRLLIQPELSAQQLAEDVLSLLQSSESSR